MITREFDLTIRVPQQDYIDTGIKLVQNDQDVYILNLRITDGITDIDYNQVDHATITFEKRDGNVVQGNLVPADTGYTYKLGTNEIACPGKVLASIQLFGEEGERLTTARFQFEVVADLITPGAVQSESRFPILQQLVADVEQLKQDIVDLQIPDNSIMDEKLSDAAGQIKQRFASHMADYASHMADYASHTADYASHTADMAAHGVSHKNLLHNWYFRNPINQRRFTHSPNAGYTIDRWRLAASAHTAELVPKGIKITASSSAGLNLCFQQFIENFKEFEGETLTLSMHIVENTLTQGCNLRWNDHASPVIMGTGYHSWTFTLPTQNELYVGLQFADRVADNGNYLIVDKMKLELGNVSTLANDPPADYGEQLALCKRYFRLWTTEAARTEALKEVGLMRIPNPTLGTIDIGGTTYYYASADL